MARGKRRHGSRAGTYRETTALLIAKATRLLRFVVCHHFIFPVTRAHGPFHLRAAGPRCIPCSLIVRFLFDLENVVNRAGTRRNAHLRLLFADRRNRNVHPRCLATG